MSSLKFYVITIFYFKKMGNSLRWKIQFRNKKINSWKSRSNFTKAFFCLFKIETSEFFQV